MDSKVDRDGVSVAVPKDMSTYANSVEFTQSQQPVEGTGAPW